MIVNEEDLPCHTPAPICYSTVGGHSTGSIETGGMPEPYLSTTRSCMRCERSSRGPILELSRSHKVSMKKRRRDQDEEAASFFVCVLREVLAAKMMREDFILRL